MIRTVNDALRRIPVWAVWLAGAIPFAVLLWDIFTGGLGVDPVQEVEHRLGQTALYFLIGGLAVTPLLRLTGVSLMRFRRAIGVDVVRHAAVEQVGGVGHDRHPRAGQ